MVKLCLTTILLIATTVCADDRSITLTGAVGGGVFIPTGNDADVASVGPSIEVGAAVATANHFGLEAELLYFPIQLDNDVLLFNSQIPDAGRAAGAPTGFHKSSQLTVLGGIRLATGVPQSGPRKPVAAISLRAGFARISTESKSVVPQRGWIGGTIERLEPDNETFFNPVYFHGDPPVAYPVPLSRANDAAVVFSPRASIHLPVSKNGAVEIGAAPIILFNRGDVSVQIHFGLRIAFSSRQAL